MGLRDGRGVDIVAIAERNDLRGLPDLDVFLAAQQEQRAIVTENVRDFRLIAREWEAKGIVHFGLVLTTNRRYRVLMLEHRDACGVLLAT